MAIAVLATIATIEARFEVRIVLTHSTEEAARKIESWAFWFAREQIESVNSIARTAELAKSIA